MEVQVHTIPLPDEELAQFADEFARQHEELESNGMSGYREYRSGNGNYTIRYHDTLTERGREVGFARIGHTLGIIDLNANHIKNTPEVTPDFVFFLIIWCRAIKELASHDTLMADKEATLYYLTTGRSVKNLKAGLLALFSTSPDIEFQKKRWEQFVKLTQHIEQ